VPATPARAAERQAWPQAAIRLFFAAEPESPAGILARVLSHRLVEALGQQVYVEHRPGEGGRIASDAVAAAAPDGLTWLAADDRHPLSALRAGLPFDLSKALQPVTQVAGRDGPLLVAHPTLPARSVGELAVLATQKGRTLELGVGGGDGDGDPAIALAAGLLRAALGPALLPRTSPAGEPALGELLAGRTLLGFVDAHDADAALRASKLRALAVAGPARLAAWPALPTLVESKVAGADVGRIDLAGWHGLWLPAGTPAGIGVRLQAEVALALKRPGMPERLAELGYRPVASTPEAFAAFIGSESARLRGLASRAGWPVR
jgi:tripartite-type tricarboxylate transporter receptor subunit TctC